MKRIVLGVAIIVGAVMVNPVQSAVAGTNPIPSIQIENQSEVVRNKEQKRTDLEARKVELNREIDNLKLDISELETLISQKNTEIEAIEEALIKSEAVEQESSDESIDQQKNDRKEQLQKELDQAQLDLIELEKELSQKQSNLATAEESLIRVEQDISEAREEVREEKDQFLVSLWVTVASYAPYVGILIALVVLYLLLRRMIKAYLPNDSAMFWGDVVLRLVFFVLMAGVILYAFADRIVNLLTFLSFFSAALVVALQDFISSFFSWLYIRSKGKYRVGDVIKVSGGNGYFFGRVKKIEIFRTLLDESVGDNEVIRELDKERPTGRIVSFPNNILLRDALVNFTQNHKTMWQSVDITITFQSDWKKAEELLQKVVEEYFHEGWLKEHQIEKSYVPKVMLSIAEDGVKFSIWFPARIGEYRETLEGLSRSVLERFHRHDIKLAYRSFTVYQGS